MERGTWLMRAGALAICLLLNVLALQGLGATPEEETLFTIAAQAYQDGLLDLAREQLQKYLAAYPQGKHLPEVRYLLGDYFYRSGDYTRAAEHMQEALQLRPAGSFRNDARYLLGRSYFENGRHPQAIQALQPLIEEGRTSPWYERALYWTGEAQLSANEFEGAVRTLQRLVDEFPASEYLEHALYSLGYARQKGDAHDAALSAFQRLLQSFPASKLRHSAEYGVARSLMALQRYEAAASHWERLRTEAPTPEQAEEASLWWGESWARAGHCEQARPAFHIYLEQFPQSQHRPDALWVMGECAYAAGEFGEAIAHFKGYVQEFPTHPRREAVLLRLADAYCQEGDLAKAHQVYSSWLEAFPESPRRTEVLARRGLVSHQREDYARSAEDFAEVLRHTHDPSQELLAHELLGESYFRLNDCAAALPHLSIAIERGEVRAQQQARQRRGLCAYRQQHYAAAVDDLSPLADSLDFQGDRQAILSLLGHSLAALDRHEEAIVRYRQFLAAGPQEGAVVDALAGLGASLLKIGQVEEALTVYERLVSQAPGLTGGERLHLQLGLLYAERHARERSEFHLRAAAAGTDPTSGAEALYHLAELLLDEGEGEEGKAILQDLTSRFPSQAQWVGIAYYRLALVFEQAQDWPRAWEAYMAAARTAVDPTLVEAAGRRAKQLEETVDVHARGEPVPAN